MAKNLDAIAKSIANREDISKHAGTIAKAHVENSRKIAKAKASRKQESSSKSKSKAGKNGKK